jgi:hypothetical protein
MRVHLTTLAMRYLRGQRTIKAAPYYGGSPFANDAAAFAALRKITGQDFGTDLAKWSAWLRKNPGGIPRDSK